MKRKKILFPLKSYQYLALFFIHQNMPTRVVFNHKEMSTLKSLDHCIHNAHLWRSIPLPGFSDMVTHF